LLLARGSADAAHPLGRGRELYFWSFVVALLIFALGSARSVRRSSHLLRESLDTAAQCRGFWGHASRSAFMKETDILRFEQVLMHLLASGQKMESGIFRTAIILAGLQDQVLLDDAVRIPRRPHLALPILPIDESSYSRTATPP
jgi:divalent metal cation (Fe/Co/Zn/Cd) transporter